MIANYVDFIGVYDGAVEPELCQDIIKKFEECSSMGLTHAGITKGGHNKTVKNSVDFDFRSAPYLWELQNKIIEAIDACYVLYQEQYPQVKNTLAQHKITSLQVQKYPANSRGAYFAFHCEAGTLDTSHRVSVYTLYLNDIKNGGETEFLDQKLRVPPRQGTICIFPSGYTHMHRGNPVLSDEDKYILTGWYNFI